MPVHNTDIAAVFDEIADFLEIGDEIRSASGPIETRPARCAH